jgi:tetratricopeptide (TPR) repeat protein
MNALRRLWIVVLVTLAGCAGVGRAPPPAAPSPPVPSRGELPVPPGPAAGPHAAVVALVDDAGRLESAAASLERALRIEPGDASLWQRLAQLRLRQREYRQAEQLARRSLLAASADRSVAAAGWRIIAAARRAEGDESGARRAAARASVLEEH